MGGHYFEIVHVHDNGRMDVKWDGDDGKVITVLIPVDDNGDVLPPAEFKTAVMEACAPNLEQWDKVGAKDNRAAVEAMMGKQIDVTDEYALRDVT